MGWNDLYSYPSLLEDFICAIPLACLFIDDRGKSGRTWAHDVMTADDGIAWDLEA